MKKITYLLFSVLLILLKVSDGYSQLSCGTASGLLNPDFEEFYHQVNGERSSFCSGQYIIPVVAHQFRDFSTGGLNTLMDIALFWNTDAQLLAKSILRNDANMDFEPLYQLPQSNGASGQSATYQNKKKGVQQEVVVLYPNPTEGDLSIAYQLPRKVFIPIMVKDRHYIYF